MADVISITLTNPLLYDIQLVIFVSYGTQDGLAGGLTQNTGIIRRNNIKYNHSRRPLPPL